MSQRKTMPSTPKISDTEKIVDYSFEKSEKSNVLAIHSTRPLIAYLINIQRSQKISKAWSSGNDSIQSPSSSINGQTAVNNTDKNKTVCIRIIDYVTRQRCLAKGIYHSRPADCAFSINSIICSQNDVIKLAVVDRASNIYLYDLSYFINDLTATRIAVIRGPGQDMTPHNSISIVWCPFVPCEDFDDGDGGLRLALATDTKLEIFAIDRIQGRTGEMQRSDLRGAYKCIHDAHATDIVTLSISPDCSTISSASRDNRVTFFSSDIDESGQRCLHNWDACITDGSSIAKLFFLDDYPKLLEDSSMKFWGAAFIGTTSGLMLLVDLRTWSVYHKANINSEGSDAKGFDYRIDSTSRNVIALNGNQCYIVQIESDHSRIVKTTRLVLHFPIFSFVIKHKSDDELELFTISAYSLEKYIINLSAPSSEEISNVSTSLANMFNLMNTSVNFPTQNAPTASIVANSNTSSSRAPDTSINLNSVTCNNALKPLSSVAAASLDINQMDRLVEALFTKLNTSFSQGLEEFLNDIKCEVNDLKLKVNGLCRDVRKVSQQLQDVRQK